MSATTAASSSSNSAANRLLRFGWRALLVSLSLGILLEALHGLKVGWYLDADNDMRRLMFTLAHAHGALLGLVSIAAALSVRLVPGVALASSTAHALIGATVLLPAGFFLGGLVVHQGDPSLGITLVPVGAALLLYAVARMARAVSGALSQSD